MHEHDFHFDSPFHIPTHVHFAARYEYGLEAQEGLPQAEGTILREECSDSYAPPLSFFFVLITRLAQNNAHAVHPPTAQASLKEARRRAL